MTKKINKDFTICYWCGKEITNNEYVANGQKSCFKCFVSYRQQKKKEEAHAIENEVVNRIRKKKYYCPKCKETKNDTDMGFTNTGLTCNKCGLRINYLLEGILQKKYKNILEL